LLYKIKIEITIKLVNLWFSVDTKNITMKHLNSHAVAATILLYLKELNGYLFTELLHDVFVTSAS
jgi:hypothetical protein